MIMTFTLFGDFPVIFKDRFAWVRNLSGDTVTASDGENTIDIPDGHASRFENNNPLILSGSGTVEVHFTSVPQCPFRSAGSTGGRGGSVLGTKTVSENGVYNASDDGFDGYSRFTVDVQAQSDYDIYLSKNDPSASLGSVGDVFVKYIEKGVEWLCDETYYVYDKDFMLWQNGVGDWAKKKSDGTAVAVCLRFSGMGLNAGVAALISTVRENVDINTKNGSSVETGTTYSADIDGTTWYTQRAILGSDKDSVPFPYVELSCSISEFQNSETVRAEAVRTILDSAHVERTLRGSAVIYTKDSTGWTEYPPTEV